MAALFTSRTAVLIPTGRRARPAPAASQRPVLSSPPPAICRRGPLNEASTRVQAIQPSGLPLAWRPQTEREPLGLFPELRTPPTRSRTTHVEEGTGHQARTWNYTLNITSVDPPIVRSLTTCDLASHRLKESRPRRDRLSGRAVASWIANARLQSWRSDSAAPAARTITRSPIRSCAAKR